MSWIVLGDKEQSCFGCNTIGRVFGYIFPCSAEQLREFGDSLPDDIRNYDDEDLITKYFIWEKQGG